MAARQTLRGRGTPVRGLHGRAGDRHRRDRPQRPQLHHCGRRPGGAQRGPRGAGQGRAYRRTVRAGFHGPQRRPKPGGSGDVRHEPGIRQRHLRTLAQRREGHRQVPHIVKHANEAVDRGRRAEGGHNTKYLCLRNETNPPEPQLEIKRSLRRRRPRTARACRMCEPCRTSAPTAPTGSGPKRGPKHCARG